MDHDAVFSRESDFTFLHALPVQHAFDVVGKNFLPFCIRNKAAKGFIGKLPPFYS
jgi:hypothetical protein